MQTDITSQAEGFFAFKEIGPIISNFVSLAIILAGALVFLYLVWGGIEYIASGGDKAHIENATKRITNAVIGLAIVATSWAIFTIIKTFFGLEDALPGS